jgi:hypothetical protein
MLKCIRNKGLTAKFAQPKDLRAVLPGQWILKSETPGLPGFSFLLLVLLYQVAHNSWALFLVGLSVGGDLVAGFLGGLGLDMRFC